MLFRWAAFCVWALVAASAVSWSLRIFAGVRPVPAGAQAPLAVASNGPMTRLFGAVAVAPTAEAPVHAESERFKLLGVIAPGYAILSIDGQLPRTWRVGSTISGDTALLSVSRRAADFGPPGGAAAFSLQLPEPGSEGPAAGAGVPPVAAPPPAVVAPTLAPPTPEVPQRRNGRRHAGRVADRQQPGQPTQQDGGQAP